MSTKIYDGKKLPNVSVFELNELYKRLRKELIPIAQKEYHKLVTKVAQSLYVYLQIGEDICEYNLDKDKINSEEGVWDAFRVLSFARKHVDEMIKRDQSAVLLFDSEPDANFEASICVLPIHDKILCIPFASNRRIFEHLLKTEEFEEYGYWNNTDQPEEISEEEWKQRRDDWDEALPGVGIPRENGIVIKLVDPQLDIFHRIGNVNTSIIPYLESDEKICERAAKNKIMLQKYQKLIEDEKKNGRDVDRTETYRYYRTALKYVEENPKKVTKLVNLYKKTIKSVEFFSSVNVGIVTPQTNE